MIKDWNRSEVMTLKDVFHFKNSLRPFVTVDTNSGIIGELFIDINEGVAYNLDELEYEGLEFYSKEEDEDFKGVEIDGTIKEWF